MNRRANTEEVKEGIKVGGLRKKDVIAQGFPIWGTCTPNGTFVLFRGYIGFERITTTVQYI